MNQQKTQEKNITMDLILLKNLKAPQLPSKNNLMPSLGQLGKILKERNNKYNLKYNPKDKEKRANQMIDEKFNLYRFQQNVKQLIKRMPVENYQSKKYDSLKNSQSFFSNFSKLSEANADQNIAGEIELTAHDIVLKSFKKLQKNPRNEGILSNFLNQLSSQIDGIKAYVSELVYQQKQKHKTIDSRKKQMLYNDVIIETVENNDYGKLVNKFKRINMNHKIDKLWNIVQKQVNQKTATDAILMSLSLVQKQFKQKLNQEINASKNNSSEFKWQKAYLLYRAGQTKLFYKYLQEIRKIDLQKHFIDYEKYIKEGKPTKIKIHFEDRQNNPYYTQLLAILKGQTTLSKNDFKNPYDLNYTWLILRLLGLYQYSQSQTSDQKKIYESVINQIKSTFIESKKQLQCISIQIMFYLSAYTEFIEIYQNQRSIDRIFSQKDYLHLLIALYYCPHPIISDDQVKSSTLQKTLTSCLIKYIQQLFNDNHHYSKQQLIKSYFLIIPSNGYKQSMEQIFNTLQKLKKMQWNSVRNKMSQLGILIEFEKCFKDNLSKVIQQSTNQNEILQLCKMYVSQLCDSEAQIEKLLVLLIKKMNENNQNKPRYYVSVSNDVIEDLINEKYPPSSNKFQIYMLIKYFRQIHYNVQRNQVQNLKKMLKNSDQYIYLPSGNKRHLLKQLFYLLKNQESSLYNWTLNQQPSILTKHTPLKFYYQFISTLQSAEEIINHTDGRIDKITAKNNQFNHILRQIKDWEDQLLEP